MSRQLTHDIICHVRSKVGLMSVLFKFAILRFLLATSVVFELQLILKKLKWLNLVRREGGIDLLKIASQVGDDPYWCLELWDTREFG